MSKTYQPDGLHPYIMDARLKKATGSGGISNIPIASADTIGGIKIGDGVSIDAGGAISGVPYSTTEYKTGRKWIDGKDIYERLVTVSLTTIEDVTTTIATEVNYIDTLISSVFVVKKAGIVGAIAANSYRDGNNNLRVRLIERWSDITEAYVIIQYTKPTTP